MVERQPCRRYCRFYVGKSIRVASGGASPASARGAIAGVLVGDELFEEGEAVRGHLAGLGVDAVDPEAGAEEGAAEDGSLGVVGGREEIAEVKVAEVGDEYVVLVEIAAKEVPKEYVEVVRGGVSDEDVQEVAAEDRVLTGGAFRFAEEGHECVGLYFSKSSMASRRVRSSCSSSRSIWVSA